MKKTLYILIAFVSVLFSLPLSAQDSDIRTVTGTVIDQDGAPMIGVYVMAQDSKTTGTMTDADGKYSIKIAGDKSLVYQCIGYETVTQYVGKRDKINVTMYVDTQELDKVVVIAYGSVKKSDLTGSVSSVDMKDIKDVPVSSVDLALQGRIAGADIMSTTGEPGATTSIRIRGTRSISATNEPLIVVDGVIDGISDLNDVNPSDIASISVLKDASATAIYGSRGSNGVIVITTKTGSSNAGRPSVTLRADAGFSHLPRQIDVMHATEFAQFRNDYALVSTSDNYADITSTTPLSKYPYPNPLSYGKGTNWMDEVTRVAPYQNYDLSVSGKNKNTSYFASVGFNNNQGIIDKSGLKRLSARFNIHHSFNKWLKVGLNQNYTYRDQLLNQASLTGTSWWSAAVFLSPMIKAYSNFNELWYSGQKFNSPRTLIEMCERERISRSMNTSGYVELTPVKGLRLKSQFTYNTYDQAENSFRPGTLPARKENEGANASREEYNSRNLLSETTASYAFDNNSGHRFDVLAGFTAQDWMCHNLYVAGSGYTLDQLKWNNMAAIPDKQNLSVSTNEVKKVKMSMLGRINYNWKSRYYLTATARYDGGSNFAEKRKWAFFPSVALKWNVNKEPFMKKSSHWLDELAVRFSAGRTGNDGISPYQSLARINSTTNGFLFDGSRPLATYVDRLASTKLTWEISDMYNVAIDFSAFKERLRVTAEAYHVDTKDLLLWVQVPSHTGYTSRLDNAGSTSNWGLELSIESHNITKKNFSWSTNFTISHNTQMVKDIASDDFVVAYAPDNASGYMMYGYVKNYPLNALWGFKDCGTWKTDEEIKRNKVTKAYAGKYMNVGYSRYADINHDGILNKDDLVYLGSADPIVYGGLQNTFNIYGFTLGVYFAYSLGGKIYNVSELHLGSGSPFTNQMRYMQNAWHPVRNPQSDLPVAGAYDKLPSSRYVHSASYFRLKNISLAYTFDTAKLTKNIIRDIRLSASAENLYLWKYYNGFDPDVSTSSSNSALRRIDVDAYPKPRTVIFSLQIRY